MTVLSSFGGWQKQVSLLSILKVMPTNPIKILWGKELQSVPSKRFDLKPKSEMIFIEVTVDYLYINLYTNQDATQTLKTLAVLLKSLLL